MEFQRVYLDSNIFITAFESPPGDEIADDLVGMLGLLQVGKPSRFVTSHITLAEVLVQPIRIADTYKRDQYVRLLSTTTPWLQVRSISQPILVLAAELRATSRLKLPDAIHAASAILTQCSHILSADADFEGMQTRIPDGLTPIRPTRDTLDQIIAWLRA